MLIKCIVKDAEDGLTQTHIATKHAISQSVVSRVLRDWSPTVDVAEMYARGKALPAIKSLVRSWKKAEELGKDGPQSKVLSVAGLLKNESGTNVGVSIVIGMPGSPAGPSVNQDVFDAALSLVPRNELSK